MLSYKTPAILKAENQAGAEHLKKTESERGTGINAAGAELSALQRHDFAAALEARKAG